MVKSVSEFVVRVDRSSRPPYPDWMIFEVHFRVLAVGPAEFSLSSLEHFVWGFQKRPGGVEGEYLHDQLERSRMIERCLDLRDAVEIQKFGGTVFRESFGNSNVFLWRSTIHDRHGDAQVPYLYLKEGEVTLGWRPIRRNKWGASDITALFPKIAG